jgi:hypothetical protein
LSVVNFGIPWGWYKCIGTCSSDYSINIVKIRNTYCALLVETDTIMLRFHYTFLTLEAVIKCIYSESCETFSAYLHVMMWVCELMQNQMAWFTSLILAVCFFFLLITRTVCSSWERISLGFNASCHTQCGRGDMVMELN